MILLGIIIDGLKNYENFGKTANYIPLYIFGIRVNNPLSCLTKISILYISLYKDHTSKYIPIFH